MKTSIAGIQSTRFCLDSEEPVSLDRKIQRIASLCLVSCRKIEASITEHIEIIDSSIQCSAGRTWRSRQYRMKSSLLGSITSSVEVG
jgi:hypothetical protein